MPKDKTYNEDDIKSISIDEFYKLRLYDVAIIRPIYVIIGFLQEYFGGYSLDEKLVDGFFVNELEKALLFKSLCERCLQESQLENDIVFTRKSTGHSTLESAQICEMLKSHYIKREADFLSHKCFQLSEDDDLFINRDENAFFNYNKYSFLIGTFIKNKIKGEPAIRFANANHKAAMTIQFLKDFEAFGARTFSVDYHFNIPHVTCIRLDEKCDFWNIVNRYIDDLKKPKNY